MTKKVIDRFDGEYAFLSNFSNSILYDDEGIEYPTVEHYFQAQKTLGLNTRLVIAAAPTPGKAKGIGRHVQLRSDWNNVKIDIMRDALIQKFSDKKLQKKLIETGDAELIEGNWWGDKFWGVCGGEGENHLGKLLMEVREMFK